MNKSQETIGPMIAHTSTVKVRIWLRAGHSILADERKFVARIFKQNSNEIIEEQQFTFHVGFDNVGLIEFGTENYLESDTLYTYNLGFLNQNSEFEKINNGTFKTFSDDKSKEISFITGSCRHLYVRKRRNADDKNETLHTDEGLHYGDRVFKTIKEKKDKAEIRPDFMIMSGDQVYCDHEEGSVSPPVPAKTLGDYYDNYYRAYSQPYFSSLAAKFPIYMAMDDHEIKNDWHMDMIDKKFGEEYKDNLEQYKNGLKAYSIYQAALSPVIMKVSLFRDELSQVCNTNYEEQLPSTPYKNKSKNLFYEFSHGPARFFSMDVRLERYMHIKRPQMIGDYQEDAIKSWLLKHRSDDLVKFIISAVPIFPDTKNALGLLISGAPEDKWGGYSEQRLRLFDFIRTKEIRKVVFLSGDVHVSLASKLQYENKDIGIFSVVSSAFSWPVPGLQRFNFDWKPIPEKSVLKKNKRMPDIATRGDYKPVPLTSWKLCKTGHREDNFCYIKTDGNKLFIQYYKASNGKEFDPIRLDL